MVATNRGGCGDRKRPTPGGGGVKDSFFIEYPLFFGLTIQASWIILVVIQVDSYWAASKSQGTLFWCVSAAFCIATMFLMGTFRSKITLLIRRKTVHFVVSLVGAAGCAGLAIAMASDPSAPSVSPVPPVLVAVCAALQSFCFAFETILWGEASRRRPLSILTPLALASIALAGLLALTCANVLDKGIVSGLVCLLPVVSAIYIYKAQHDNVSYLKPQEFDVLPDGSRVAKEGVRWQETSDVLNISKRRFALLMARVAFLFGLALAVLSFNAAACVGAEPIVAGGGGICSLIAAVAFTALYFHIVNGAGSPCASPSRHLFLLFVVLLLFTGGDHIGVEDVSLLALFVALLWIYPAELMQKYRISPLLSYGYFMGFLIVAFFFGLFLVSSFASALTPLATMLAAAASVLLGTACFISDAHIKNMAKSEAALIDEMRVATPQGEVKLHSLRCRKIADTYLLSKRESEILFYLAKGRRSSYIQKELTLSEGTVRTHMRSIYRKLNVHSQQELMDLVDDAIRRISE